MENDMKIDRVLATGLVLLATLGLSSGCGQKEKATKEEPTKLRTDRGDRHKEGHVHGAGPHGGAVADWGGGKYHVEFTVDHDKQEATVYILGRDEKTPAPIKAKDGEILLTINEPASKIPLKASPMKGESEGASSRFVGNHKSLAIVREYEGTISGVVDGTPYTGKFKEEPEKK